MLASTAAVMENPLSVDIEGEPLLMNEKEALSAHVEPIRYRRVSVAERHGVTLRACLVHLSIIALYTTAYIVATSRNSRKFTLLHDTLRDLDVRTKSTPYIVAGQSPYAGGPTAEVDGAWHDLLANISIRVTDEELSRNGDRRESVRLQQAGGQMAWLGVFHQLHCLKKLRQLNYPEAYAPHLNEDQRWDQEVHVNHCIELLRQSVMCNPDISLTTFSWSRTKPKPVLNIGGFERKCVDWEPFMHNILPRVIDAQEVDNLQNPNLITM